MPAAAALAAISTKLAQQVPPHQPAFQPGACKAAEQYLMQCNLVGRVVRKGLDEGCMVSVIFNDLSRHRKKMAPVRSSTDFHAAALSDAGVCLTSTVPCVLCLRLLNDAQSC